MAITIPDATASFGKLEAGTFVDGSRRAVISRTIDENGVSWGQACFSTASSRVATATPGGDFLGIAVADEGNVPLPSAFGGAISLDGDLTGRPQAARDFYPARSTVAIATGGKVRVTSGGSVTRGAPAYVTPAGLLVATASGNIRIRAFFDDDAALGAVVALRIGTL